jgi:hypothetical protein
MGTLRRKLRTGTHELLLTMCNPTVNLLLFTFDIHTPATTRSGGRRVNVKTIVLKRKLIIVSKNIEFTKTASHIF